MSENIHKSHNVSRLMYHFVFPTKYRRVVVDNEVEEVIKRLKGIDCGGRGTSCPDQLAKALEQYLEENK